ncbi:MAG: glycosyltransferase family 2 protein [Patescibacteria group bacterium]
MVDVSVLILNYKSKEWVWRNLTALKQSIEYTQKKNVTFEVIVIDGTEGGDGTCPMVWENFKEFSCLDLKKNLGFPSGNNQGLKVAKGRYILLLNPDALVEDNTLAQMVEFMDLRTDVGVATCKLVLLKTGKIDPASHRGVPTPWASLMYYTKLEAIFPRSKLFGGYHMGWEDLEREHEIGACAGSFMMIRRQALEAIGGKFDEAYYMYAEDIDTCFRILKKGWKIMYYPYVKCFHYKGSNSGIKKETQKETLVSKEGKIKAINAFWDDNKLFFNKHLKSHLPLFVTYLVYIGVYVKKWIALKRLHV